MAGGVKIERTASARSRDMSFLLLAVQVVVFHTLSANCHERIFADGTFKLPWFLTMTEFISNALLAGAKRYTHGAPFLSGFNRDHVTCALTMCITHGCSNATLVHLNYTTTTLFKSAKVFFVMMGGWVIHGRQVSIAEWLAAMALFVGLAVFGLADKMTSPKFTVLGVVLTMGSLMGGSVAGNLQQKAAQRENGKSPEERKDDLLFFQYTIASAICFVICFAGGELGEGVRFFSSGSVWQLLNMGAFLLSLFLGLQPLLTLVQQYDATSATIVTSLRKVVTFTSSFLFFPKPFTFMHAGSAAVAMGGAYALQKLRDGRGHGGHAKHA